MSTRYNPRPVHLDRTKCFIGEPPSASLTAMPAIKTQNHLRNWAYNSNHFMFSGPPFSALNPHYSGRFYIIGNGAETAYGNDREAAVAFLPWGTHSSGESPYLYWYPDYTATTSTDRITLYESEDPYADTDDWYDYAGGVILKTYGTNDSGAPSLLQYDVGIVNQMCCSALDYGDFTPAAVSVWQKKPGLMARPTQNIIVEEDVIPGTVIRGFDSGDRYRTGTQPSFGHLVHYMGDKSWGIEGGSSIDTVDHATRRCMYQHGHPAGYWTDANTYSNMYNTFKPVVQPRNLWASINAHNNDHVCYPSAVVSGNGTIQYEITTDRGTYTSTYTHASATVTLIQPSDFTGALKAEPGAQNEMEITIKATVDGEFTVHTVSLWEGPAVPPS